jgi:hypothetical protein
MIIIIQPKLAQINFPCFDIFNDCFSTDFYQMEIQIQNLVVRIITILFEKDRS